MKYTCLHSPRLAGAEDCSRVLQAILPNSRRERVCAAEHAPRDPFYFPERPIGLAEIIERGGGVLVERLRV